MSRRNTVADFWRHVVKGDGCWLWSGPKNPTYGYGSFSGVVGEQHLTTAHRYSFAVANGPIPDGLQVLHRCDVTACVRPDHLFLGTQRDNMLDAIAKGRHPVLVLAARRRALTHCKHGHEFTHSNTYITGRGGRMCKTCNRATSLRNYHIRRDIQHKRQHGG